MFRPPVLALVGVLLLAACSRPAPSPPSDRLVAAVRADSLAGVLELLDAGADPRLPAADGALPIADAARLGRDTILAELLLAGADPTAMDGAGLTAFDQAMAGDHPAIADRLILHAARAAGGGARVMAWFAAVPGSGTTADPWQEVLSGELLSLGVMYAALHDRTDLIGAMRRAREIPNRTGYHALAVAARWGREQAVWSLLGVDTHPDLVTSGRWRSTPLMEAARSGHVAIGRRLLAAGARADRTDALGETALHWAARSGAAEYARMLLEAGADPRLEGSAGQTAADVALTAGHAELAAELAAATGQ